MTDALTEEELTVLRSMFDLARSGDTGLLTEAIDAGIPVNLTNSAGDSLLILAAYHGHPDTVRRCVTARRASQAATLTATAARRQPSELHQPSNSCVRPGLSSVPRAGRP